MRALGWVSFFTDVSTEIIYPLLPVFLTVTLGASTALVYLGFGAAQEAWQIWALFVAHGLFYGMTESAERALVADFYPDAQRGRAFGAFHFLTGIAALPASLVMGLLWEWAGPGVAFGCGALLALGAAAWLALARPLRAAHTA